MTFVKNYISLLSIPFDFSLLFSYLVWTIRFWKDIILVECQQTKLQPDRSFVWTSRIQILLRLTLYFVRLFFAPRNLFRCSKSWHLWHNRKLIGYLVQRVYRAYVVHRMLIGRLKKRSNTFAKCSLNCNSSRLF